MQDVLTDRSAIRRLMRTQRRSVDTYARAQAAKAFARWANRLFLLRPGMRIGVYHAYRDEADLSELIALARQHGCKLYLPIIKHARRHRMEFASFESDSVLRNNIFGIPEPAARTATTINVRSLDLLFVPLTAFDDCGWRLGSGAGFYDRRLQHLRAQRLWRRPRLIGIAYDFQHVPALQPHRWDVPLDAVITEQHFYRCHPTRTGPSA